MKENEKVYLLTDGCLWEINKQTGNEHPHATEVVELETGAVRYIKSGSRIKFISGEISDIRTQEAYNKKTTEVSCDGQSELQGEKGKKSGRKNKAPSV